MFFYIYKNEKDNENWLLEEVKSIRQHCEKNVHEYSAFHYL